MTGVLTLGMTGALTVLGEIMSQVETEFVRWCAPTPVAQATSERPPSDRIFRE